MKAIPLLSLLLLTGCASMPGHVESSRSEFDGTSQVAVERAWVYTGWKAVPFGLGVHHTTAMSSNDVVIVAWSGSGNIAGGASLGFSFNGQITNLVSIDSYNEITSGPGPYVWSSKRYAVDVAFLTRLVTESNVTARLHLDRSYIEGRISSDAPTTIRPALRKFMARLGETNLNEAPNAPARSPKGQ